MEHEIIGHTKKAFKVWKDPGKRFWEKFREILIEVVIIVFAVTFAAFIERTREHFKEQSEAKEFVLALRGDLNNEIQNINDSKTSMDTLIKNYTFFHGLNAHSIDSLKNRQRHVSFNISKFTTQLANGRYDGFRSSGKIQTISNDTLRNNILKLYQEDIPYLLFAESAFNDNQKRLENFILTSPDNNTDKTPDVIELLVHGNAKLIMEFAISYSKGVQDAYNRALAQAKKIRAEIDEEYKE